jgi:hypothetical protein
LKATTKTNDLRRQGIQRREIALDIENDSKKSDTKEKREEREKKQRVHHERTLQMNHRTMSAT